MHEADRPSRPVRPYVVAGLTLALAVLAFVYRFNALGGALGGLDNDHYIYFVQARQMLYGEVPLRDFADAGLQGAWPWPTYALSLAGQRWLEPTLWPEGLLSAAAIATAVAMIFNLSSRVAPMGVAVIVSLLTLFVGTKLYNYPRAIVFAVVVAVMMRYARRPTAGMAAALGAWGAVAFLFRHDFAVYVAIAGAVLFAATHRLRAWRAGAAHLSIAAAVAGVMLVPPLISIQRAQGLGRYFGTALEMSRRERERTTWRRPQIVNTGAGIAGLLSTEENAVAWVFHLAWLIPVVALLSLRRLQAPGFEPHRFRALVVSLAALSLILDYSFLRGNIGARLGDLGAPVAVLAAILMARRLDDGRVRAAIRYTVVTVVLLGTTVSIWAVGSVAHELDTTGLSDSWGKVQRRFVAAQRTLRALPGQGPDATRIPAASAYLRACTRPVDRVMVAASEAATIVMSERRFAGGHSTFTQGFYGSAEDQRETIERLRAQSVPIVIAEEGDLYDRNFAVSFPEIYAYLQQHYRAAGHVGAGEEQRQVLVHQSMQATATDPATGLPCFQ